METFIVVVIVGLAVIYLVKRYLRIFRPRADSACDCGCSSCDQESTCSSDAKTIQPRL
ncbi:MAG: FeoB-associated Cys-rich membrane protein [Desulfosarcina sp.]|nr:FeoB-associated Cys-rich membrane protein [Desulfobacterales bacterium]